MEASEKYLLNDAKPLKESKEYKFVILDFTRQSRSGTIIYTTGDLVLISKQIVLIISFNNLIL